MDTYFEGDNTRLLKGLERFMELAQERAVKLTVDDNGKQHLVNRDGTPFEPKK